MIEAYLDESGIHEGAQVCVIAGYFAGRGQWKRFQSDWISALKRFDVPLEQFHAKDLLPSPKGFFHQWDRDLHRRLLQDLAGCIADHEKIYPVTAAIVVRDFNSFSADERRFFTGADIHEGKLTSSGCPGKPYFVPFQLCVIKICNYAPRGGHADFYVGVDRPFCGYATTLFDQIKRGELRGMKWFEWKDRLGKVAFPLAKKTPQLQAADFLAYLSYRHIVAAGSKVGMLKPQGALATCIINARSIDDFFIQNRSNLQASLRDAAQITEALKVAGL